MLDDILPLTPAHWVLYGLTGDLTAEQARQLWRPYLDLVERVQAGEDVRKPAKRNGQRKANGRKGGAR